MPIRIRSLFYTSLRVLKSKLYTAFQAKNADYVLAKRNRAAQEATLAPNYFSGQSLNQNEEYISANRKGVADNCTCNANASRRILQYNISLSILILPYNSSQFLYIPSL